VIRVLIADDQALLRAGLRMLLEAEPDIAVVGEAADGEEAVSLAREARPDVILMDIRMPGVDGVEATRLLSPAATRRLIQEFAAWPERGSSAPDQLDELTDREREVMALVAYGLTNREIAERLVVSPATAKTHVTRAMGKLHAHDRAQLVVLAYQTALASANEAGAARAADRIAARI
jgi:DNA-binding NarL/FixJ family response regulator